MVGNSTLNWDLATLAKNYPGCSAEILINPPLWHLLSENIQDTLIRKEKTSRKEKGRRGKRPPVFTWLSIKQ